MPLIHVKLDWLSSFLTVVSMLMVGRRQWWGWLVAALNCFVLLYIAHQSRPRGPDTREHYLLGDLREEYSRMA